MVPGALTPGHTLEHLKLLPGYTHHSEQVSAACALRIDTEARGKQARRGRGAVRRIQQGRRLSGEGERKNVARRRGLGALSAAGADGGGVRS